MSWGEFENRKTRSGSAAACTCLAVLVTIDATCRVFAISNSDSNLFLAAMSLLDESVPQDDQIKDRSRLFERFLESESTIYDYKDEIHRMLRTDQTRLLVNIDDLRDFDRESANGLLKNPVDFVPAFDLTAAGCR